MLDPWFTANLVCPLDHQSLTFSDGQLQCASNHRYPVVTMCR
jgi:hypothetical protein